MCLGFYWSGELKGGNRWGGIALLFVGLFATFSGVLLAFAPRFFI